MELGAMRILLGTNAERLALALELLTHTGRFFFETDTLMLYFCDGHNWYLSSSWAYVQDEILTTEEGQPLTTEDGQEIGLEREP